MAIARNKVPNQSLSVKNPVLLFFAGMLLFCAVFLSACSGESPSPDTVDLPTEVKDLDELKTFECNDDFIDEKVYVLDIEKNYECDGKKWFESDDQAKPKSSSRKSEKSSSSRGDTLAKSSSSLENDSRDTSSSLLPPCRNDKVDTCIYGILTDKRDGHSYKTVVIGDQVWMAENLNYDSGDELSYCFFANDCERYGRHYEWSAAVDSINTGYGSTEATCPVNKPVKGVCPDGWHIPSRAEWETMLDNVGGRKSAGINLRSTEDWANPASNFIAGLDLYGFSVLRVPQLNTTRSIFLTGHGFDRFVQAAFWGIDNQYCMHTIGFNPKESGYENAGEFYRPANSIRCLRDEPYTGSLVSDEKSTSTHKPPSIEYYLNKDKTYGEFSDKRDGKVYKTIEIDGQTWMAQNLNYKTPDGRSVCIQDDEKICEVFGRQYTWSVAVDSAGNNLSHYKKIDHFPWQGICPDGWHIPSYDEWMTLFFSVASDTTHYFRDIIIHDAAPKLMSTKMWLEKSTHTDEFGLSILPEFNRLYAYYLSAEGDYNNFDKASYTLIKFESTWPDGSTLELEDIMYSNDHEGFLRCVKDGSAIRFPTEYVLADTCNVGGVDNCDYGTLTDKRDGNVYKTVKIGEQEWMAENLRYADSVKTPSLKARTMCKDSIDANCEKYGRLYSWFATIDSARYYTSEENSMCGCKYVCKLERNHQGICPDGWRLPNIIDYEILFRSTANDVALASDGEWSDNVLRPDSLDANLYGFSLLPTSWKKDPLEDAATAGIWTSSVSSGQNDSNAHFVFVNFAYDNKYASSSKVLRSEFDNANCYRYKAIRCIKE